eukprot:1276656-Rhodomonas_salina.1
MVLPVINDVGPIPGTISAICLRARCTMPSTDPTCNSFYIRLAAYPLAVQCVVLSYSTVSSGSSRARCLSYLSSRYAPLPAMIQYHNPTRSLLRARYTNLAYDATRERRGSTRRVQVHSATSYARSLRCPLPPTRRTRVVQDVRH